MSALHFPPGAVDTLKLDGPDLATCDMPFSKWLIYNIEAAPKEAQELYLAAMEFDPLHPSESERELQRFLKPAQQDVSPPDVQGVLDHHLRVLEGMHTELDRSGHWDWEVYIYGFIVITSADWRERGVTAVHCDVERGKWKVEQCKDMPVNQLWQLRSVTFDDSTFDRFFEQFDASGNDGPDSQGGPVPEGEWQFAVYCTSASDSATLRSDAEREIEDPRNHWSYRHSEECLCFLEQDLPAEHVNENWPLDYAKFDREPDTYSSVCKRHPSLFVHIRDNLSNIEIVKMDWDHDISRSDEELKRIGRESTTSVQECDADSLVSTLLQLAQDT